MKSIILLLVVASTIGCETGSEKMHSQSQQPPSLTREEARGTLERMGVTYTEKAFIENAQNGSVSTVALFLDAGIDPDAKDENGQSALLAAVAAGHAEVVRLLLDKGASVSTELGTHLLHHAAGKGQTATAQALVEKGVDVNARDGVGYTALMRAAEEGQNETIRMLIAKGADVNAQEMHGYSSVMWAVVKGKKDTVRVLLDHGADINARERKRQWTALMMAAVKGDAEMVELLLEKGADTTLTNTTGATALAVARKRRDPATVQLLEQAEAQ